MNILLSIKTNIKKYLTLILLLVISSIISFSICYFTCGVRDPITAVSWVSFNENEIVFKKYEKTTSNNLIYEKTNNIRKWIDKDGIFYEIGIRAKKYNEIAFGAIITFIIYNTIIFSILLIIKGCIRNKNIKE